MIRALGLLAEFILWMLITFIAGSVLVYGQSRIGNSPTAEPHTAAQPQSDSRPCPSFADIPDGFLDTAWSMVRCWYASRKQAGSENSQNLDVNSQDNPIRQRSDVGPRIEKSTKEAVQPPSYGATARNCEEQALKLFDPEEMKQTGMDEKSTFIRECKSN